MAKIRHPAGVFLLAFITLGIYYYFWWYYINREMRDLGRARSVAGLGDSPGLSTAAWIFGGLIIVPLVWTIVTTTQRIYRSQEVNGVANRLNGWVACLVWVFTLGIAGPIYTQHQINKVWLEEHLAAVGDGAVAAAVTLDESEE